MKRRSGGCAAEFMFAIIALVVFWLFITLWYGFVGAII